MQRELLGAEVEAEGQHSADMTDLYGHLPRGRAVDGVEGYSLVLLEHHGEPDLGVVHPSRTSDIYWIV